MLKRTAVSFAFDSETHTFAPKLIIEMSRKTFPAASLTAPKTLSTQAKRVAQVPVSTAPLCARPAASVRKAVKGLLSSPSLSLYKMGGLR